MLHLRMELKLPSHFVDFGNKLIKMIDTYSRFLSIRTIKHTNNKHGVTAMAGGRSEECTFYPILGITLTVD